uniref:Coiled-coil domain containing 66 n=1 Tax=Poecilia formosa TaxID=48698 RepID=A0A096MHJ9_POEFO
MKQEGDDEYGRLHRSSFSWFKERRPDSRAAIDAKKAQWKRELDEQVALKQQLQLSALSRLQGEEYAESVSSVGHREHPAAIRSSLRLGEVTPMEEMLSVERKEEQRRVWLEELDRQREETAERRKQEKLQRRQTEDHEHWAAHFDSLQRRAPAQPAAPGRLSGSERDDWNPSSSLSLVWEGTSSCGADSVMAASVDSTRGFPSRSSYLRTMTSLLDPAQIEERERRRLKQLEQQRFILAQRAIEAQKLQKQYELEILKKKEKVRGQKMSHLHHWQKINSFRFHQKRKKKSEILLNLNNSILFSCFCRSSKTATFRRELASLNQRYFIIFEISAKSQKHGTIALYNSSRRPLPSSTLGVCQYPTAIRFLLFSFWSSFRTIRSLRRSSQRSTAGRRRRPDPEVTNVAVLVPSLTESIGLSDNQNRPAPCGSAEPNSRSRAPRAGKENICLPAGEDPYAPFARTERSRRSKTRPEWGTQRPSRRFVPASERYPVALQRDRQESRLRRQAELLALQKTRPSRTE